MKKAAAITSAFLLMTTLLVIAPHSALAGQGPAAAHSSSRLVIPVTITSPAGASNGSFRLTGFALQNGQLVANGLLSWIDSAGSHLAVASAPVTTGSSTAAAAAAASCPILHLVIGPISLNLLGLQVTTNQIVLDITAIPGPGNLLGNLLCDVANLLNGSPTQNLVNLLNQIVAILEGL